MEELSRTQPIARKQHRCDFCAGIIEKGEKYDHSTYSSNGSVYTWKSHLHCLALTSEMDCNEDGISSDDFEEWVHEYVHDNHYDNELDDVSEKWRDQSVSELAKIIYNEISENKNKP